VELPNAMQLVSNCIIFNYNYSHRRAEDTLCLAAAAAAEVVGPVLVDGTTSESASFSDSDEWYTSAS